jgi:hypothetical protein
VPLVFVVTLQLFQRLCGAQQSNTTSREDAFLDGGPSCMHGIVNTILALLHLNLRGTADAGSLQRRLRAWPCAPAASHGRSEAVSSICALIWAMRGVSFHRSGYTGFNPHLVGVGNEIGGNVAAIELHALDHFELGLERLRLLDGDNPLIAIASAMKRPISASPLAEIVPPGRSLRSRLPPFH